MKIPMPIKPEELQGVDGKVRYIDTEGRGADFGQEESVTEISVKLFAIIPPEKIMPEPEKRCAEVERQLREGLEAAIKRLKEKMLRSTGQKSVIF